MSLEIGNFSAAQIRPVEDALKRAADATGAGFDFLAKMAARESSFNPDAKAKTSSAAGLFQFIEQTWLGAVKKYGGGHGLGAYAADISRADNGRLSVANAERREEILNLRFNPDHAAALAGEIAGENKAFLEKRLGRAVGGTELYAAHFLGPSGAVKLLSAAPDAKAAEILPSAAKANKSVFYDGARSRSVSELVASLEKSMGGAVEAKPVENGAMTAAASVTATMLGARVVPVMNARAPLIDMGKSLAALISGPNKSSAPSLITATPRQSAMSLALLQSLEVANSQGREYREDEERHAHKIRSQFSR